MENRPSSAHAVNDGKGRCIPFCIIITREGLTICAQVQYRDGCSVYVISSSDLARMQVRSYEQSLSQRLRLYMVLPGSLGVKGKGGAVPARSSNIAFGNEEESSLR